MLPERIAAHCRVSLLLVTIRSEQCRELGVTGTSNGLGGCETWQSVRLGTVHCRQQRLPLWAWRLRRYFGGVTQLAARTMSGAPVT